MGYDLDAIEQAAQTLESGNCHGPWVWQGGYPQRITNGAAIVIADCFENPDFPSSVAEFIATASPDVLLALVEVTRAAQRLLPLLQLVCDEECELEHALLLFDARRITPA